MQSQQIWNLCKLFQLNSSELQKESSLILWHFFSKYFENGTFDLPSFLFMRIKKRKNKPINYFIFMLTPSKIQFECHVQDEIMVARERRSLPHLHNFRNGIYKIKKRCKHTFKYKRMILSHNFKPALFWVEDESRHRYKVMRAVSWAVFPTE